MQHNRAGRKLRRTTSHRLAMFSNQLASLMTHERIQTTLTKAKELRPLAERLITAAKNDGVAARRQVAQWIPDRTTVKKLFETIAPRFVDRPGGYTRILRLGARPGDAAEAAILEFVDYQLRAQGEGAEEGVAFRPRPASRRRTGRDGPQAEAGGSGGREEKAEAAPKKPLKVGKPQRGAKKGAKPSKQAPAKGPSRTGHIEAGSVGGSRVIGRLAMGDRRSLSITRSPDHPIRRCASATRVAALVWGLFLFALTSWPRPPRVPVVSGIPNFDKLVHFGLYARGGASSCTARCGGRGGAGFSLARVLAVVGAMAVWGVADEVHQSWIPGRSMEGEDVAADVAGGGGVGASSSAVARRCSRGRAPIRVRAESSLRSG